MPIFKMLSLFLLLLSAQLSAKTYEFTHRQMVAGPLEESAPQVYLFNQQGELIHASMRYFPNMLMIFKKTTALAESNEIKQNLNTLLGELPDFGSVPFTLFITTIAEDIGPCPPCRMQEEELAKVQKRFGAEKLSVNIIKTINETYIIKD